MDEDYAVKFISVRDESIPQPDLTVQKFRRYDFLIGKHGPFVERVSLDTFSDAEITRRVELVRSHLRALPR